MAPPSVSSACPSRSPPMAGALKKSARQLLHHSLPHKRALDDGPVELRSINPQGHAVRTLESVPSLGRSAHRVGRLIDLVMPEHKTLLRVDLDCGTVSAEAFDRR